MTDETKTVLNIKFNDKDKAKMCGAVWEMDLKKWAYYGNIKTFQDSFDYLLNNKFDEDDFICVADRFSKKIKYYVYKKKYTFKKTTSFYVGRGQRSNEYETGEIGVYYEDTLYINKNDIKDKYKYLEIYNSSILRIMKEKHHRYKYNKTVYFGLDSNYYKMYKSLDKVYTYDLSDYKENKISTIEIKRIYKLLKFINIIDRTHQNFYKEFYGDFFKYALHLKMNIDPITTLTNMHKDVANIIYDYMN